MITRSTVVVAKEAALTARSAIALALLAVTIAAAPIRAQMTVSGRVTGGDRPVQGALVGIPELRIETRTTADGSYNFLIRSSQVVGQMVTITARHRQFGSASVRVQLTGGSLEQNFVLGRETQAPPPPHDTVRRVPPPVDTARRIPVDTIRRTDTTARVDTTRRIAPRTTARPNARVTPTLTLGPARFVVDSSVLSEAAGPADLATALAGRIPGLLVTSASTVGGSSPMVYRGARSLTGALQPLVVLDGIPIDNSGFRTAAQQFGLGGFDYGTPLQDIPLEDVGTVELLDQARAAALYGSRAANGVLVVTTKQGASTPGFSFSHRLRFTREAAVRLPSYQNSYGQGSGGVFEFFDGRGGGINDNVEESWGPVLQGQPVIQHGLTESHQPDVRAWAPHPSGVRDYFDNGRTFDGNLAVQGSRGSNSLRASLGLRSASGVTPDASNRWMSAAVSGSAKPTSRLSARGSVLVVGARAEDRPGTGYDEINPVAGFTRFGRQVDVPALRAHLRDTVDQINWIYTSRNNPWFQSQANANDDHHGHIVAGADVTYDLSSVLYATLRGGTDNYHEARNFHVAPDWRGGYPTALGRGDFAGGGGQQQKNSSAERLIDLSLSTRSIAALSSGLTGTLGVQARRNSYQATAVITDSTATARFETSAIDTTASTVKALYVTGGLNHDDFVFVNAGARVEKASARDSSTAAAVFPTFSVAYDASKTIASLNRLGTAMLRASWWRSGNEITPRTLASTFAGAGSPTSPLFGVTGMYSGPERTTGTELGLELSTKGSRIGFGATVYSEKSSSVLVPAANAFTQVGEVANKGFELQLRTEPYRNEGDLRWNVDVSFAKNTSTLESIDGATSEIALSPDLWGTRLVGQVGKPVGQIVGSRLLRDPAGALLLKNGLPIADATAPVAFGSWQPDWSSGIGTQLRYRGFNVSLLFDVRMGGKIFSATNKWGSSAGTLTSTLLGRDTGLVVTGIDSASGAPNTNNVSAEAYFHALGAVSEPWVYDASYAKLRQVSLTYELPLRFLPGYREQLARISVVGRNLFTWAKAPNIDPETALSVGPFQGFEMGQLPATRSIGLQLAIAP